MAEENRDLKEIVRQKAGVDFHLRLIAKVVLSIALAHYAATMVIQYMEPSIPAWGITLIDSLLLVLFLLFPLYMLIVNPLFQQIAERKRVESELEGAFDEINDRKVFIESILANIQSGIIVVDLDMRIMLANDYAMQFLGKGLSQLKGGELDEICPGIAASIRSGNNHA